MKGTQEALGQLLPAAEMFPTLWTVPCNLSCYCAQLGRLNEWGEWFKKALAIDEQEVKQAAIDHADLRPLWDSMSGTFWKGAE